MHSHCADAVVSLANKVTIVGEVSSELQKFAARWVQSASTDYDVIVATTFRKGWLTNHELVISTPSAGHMLYSEWTSLYPNGREVVCLNGCQPNMKYRARGPKTRFMCRHCKSVGWVKLTPPAKPQLLDKYSLVKTKYPRSRSKVLWTKDGEGEPDMERVDFVDGSASENEGQDTKTSLPPSTSPPTMRRSAHNTVADVIPGPSVLPTPSISPVSTGPQFKTSVKRQMKTRQVSERAIGHSTSLSAVSTPQLAPTRPPTPVPMPFATPPSQIFHPEDLSLRSKPGVPIKQGGSSNPRTVSLAQRPPPMNASTSLPIPAPSHISRPVSDPPTPSLSTSTLLKVPRPGPITRARSTPQLKKRHHDSSADISTPPESTSRDSSSSKRQRKR